MRLAEFSPFICDRGPPRGRGLQNRPLSGNRRAPGRSKKRGNGSLLREVMIIITVIAIIIKIGPAQHPLARFHIRIGLRP